MTSSNQRTSHYITGFDGIRAIAVIAVIFYHLLPSSLVGGYLGVPVFLVISGYLITDQFLKEWDKTNKIDLKKFYVRRIKRIFPGLIAVLTISAAYITLFQRDLLNNLRQTVLSCVLFVNNWWQINNGLSYFDRFTSESPFTHLWSLAIEGQNYIIFPILLLLLLHIFKKKRNFFLFSFFMIASILSALWMAYLFVPGTDPTRVYYGTDTRIFSIWLGSALATILPSASANKKLSTIAKHLMLGAGSVSLLLIILSFIFLDPQNTFVYYGGIFLVSVLCVILVAVTIFSEAKWNKLLTNRFFTWVGQRSFGIYLYQFPVMIFYEAKFTAEQDLLLLHAIDKLVIIAIISELSYRFIETPLKNFNYKAIGSFLKMNWKKSLLPIGAAISLLTVATIGIISAPTNYKSAERIELEEHIEESEKLITKPRSFATAPLQAMHKYRQKVAEEEAELDLFLEEHYRDLITKYNLTGRQLLKASEMDISIIGDSVLLVAASDLQTIFPMAILDGAVSRQVSEAEDIVTSLVERNALKDNILIILGTNGSFMEQTFTDLMDQLGERNIYWVNVREPNGTWQDSVNESLARNKDNYQNLTIIDWFSLSNSHDDWFRFDQFHPNELGAEQYASLVGQAILME